MYIACIIIIIMVVIIVVEISRRLKPYVHIFDIMLVPFKHRPSPSLAYDQEK